MADNQTKVSNGYLSNNPDFDVADDLVGTKRYQQVKLIDSTVGSTTPVGTAANPLHVQGTAVGGDVNIAEVGGVAVALGQTTESASIPVTLATTQDTADTDATYGNFTRVGVPWSDYNTETLGWHAWPTVGQGQNSTMPAVAVTAQDANSDACVAIAATAATPSASSNGLVTKSILYASKGAGTDSLSLDDSNRLTTAPIRSSSATISRTAASASSVTLISSNTTRTGAVVVNESSSVLRIKLGTSASATSYTYLLPGSTGAPYATWEMSNFIYTGTITGIWDSATGSAQVTEIG